VGEALLAHYLAEVKRLQHGNPLSATLVECLCQPPLNWDWGCWGAWVADRHCAFTGLQAHLQGTDLVENSLDGVECTAHHHGCGGVAGIVLVAMSLLSIKRPCSRHFHQSGD